MNPCTHHIHQIHNNNYIPTVFLPVYAHLSEIHDVAGKSAYIYRFINKSSMHYNLYSTSTAHIDDSKIPYQYAVYTDILHTVYTQMRIHTIHTHILYTQYTP